MSIQNGSKVSLHYTLTLDDGSVADSSDGREPLAFVIGQRQVIPGFENGVLGLNEGDEKDIVVPAEQGYGIHREELIQKVPLTLFKDFTPEVGQQIGLMGKDGRKLTAKVNHVDAGFALLDLNHPLAGKTLHFHVKIVAVA